MNNQRTEPDKMRYCELGDHNAFSTIRCKDCLKFICSNHVHLHTPQPAKQPKATLPPRLETQQTRPQLSLATAIIDVSKALIYKKLTLPIERYANRIRNDWKAPNTKLLALPAPEDLAPQRKKVTRKTNVALVTQQEVRNTQP